MCKGKHSSSATARLQPQVTDKSETRTRTVVSAEQSRLALEERVECRALIFWRNKTRSPNQILLRLLTAGELRDNSLIFDIKMWIYLHSHLST